MREHLDAEGLTQERPGHGARGHTRGGLAGAGTFEHRTRVVEAVLEHARVVGVAGAWPRERGVARDVQIGRVDRVGRHHALPLGPFGVADLDRDGAAQCEAVPDPGQHRDLVLFELHPGATAVAEAAPLELCPDLLRSDGHAGDHPFEHGHQGAAVGFTSCGPTQHGCHSPTPGFAERNPYQPGLSPG